MKKITAGILALTMLVFTGCSGATSIIDPYGINASRGKVTEAKLNDLTYVLQIGDYGISKQYYSDLIMAYSTQFTSGNISYLTDGSEEGKELFDIIKESVANVLLQEIAFSGVAEELGIAITEEDEALLQSELDAYITQLGGQSAYDQMLEQAGISSEFYSRQIYISQLSNRIYEYYTNPDNGNVATTEELKEIASESYVMVKHVLVDEASLETAVDAEGNPYEDLDSLAKDISDRAKDGEDFDALIEEYNQDPGMETNPDGYFFTYGTMVTEFETEAYNMSVGDISDPVATDYGYHILNKIEISDEVIEANTEMLSSNYIISIIDAELTEKMDGLEVVYSSQYDSLTFDILFPELLI